MSEFTRRVNRVLGRTVGVQVVPGRTRSVRVDATWFTRLVFFTDLVQHISDVEGDLVECGVADGAGLALIASIARAVGTLDGRRVWGYDAWSGLPEPTAADLAHEGSIATGGMFAYTSTRRVTEEFEAHGWGREEIASTVTLVPGYFEQTLPRFDRRIALLHIDADLYESYRCALTTLWPRVQPGGIIAFDEYEETERWPGARRAVDEFRESLPAGATTLHQDEPSGKWWMVKRSDASPSE